MMAALRRLLLALACIVPAWSVAHAVTLDGVQLPDTMEANGKALRLNGFGLRTYSLLRLHIYVAALYLEHASHSSKAIIRSAETKLLTVAFVRDISADAARNSWRDGLANNCRAPCQLDPDDVARFLAAMPAMHAGDNFSILFTPEGATVSVGDRQIGVISHPQFAAAILATFLGRQPASPRLKRELLARAN